MLSFLIGSNNINQYHTDNKQKQITDFHGHTDNINSKKTRSMKVNICITISYEEK